MGPRCGFRPAFGSWVAPSFCCYIWDGKQFSSWKHWLCLVVLGKRGKARHGWQREIHGGLNAAKLVSPCLLGTPRKPEDRQGRRPIRRTKYTGQERRRTAYLSGDIRLRFSLRLSKAVGRFQTCEVWAGISPFPPRHSSPHRHSRADYPQEKSCSVNTEPHVHKELPPGSWG